ncbi:MAG: GNAT family N-acetyltransferase [Rhodospirillales bacterium]
MPIIHTLPGADLDKYRDHLLRLSADDRRFRFGNCLSDAGITGFVDGLRPRENHIFVDQETTGKVVGAVQIAVRYGSDAELALSVDAEHRRRGVAYVLAKRAILWARNRRIRSVCMSCLAENRPMRRLAKKVGMEMDADGGLVEAKLSLPPPTPLSLAREAAYDTAAFRDAEFAAWRARPAGRPLAALTPLPLLAARLVPRFALLD